MALFWLPCWPTEYWRGSSPSPRLSGESAPVANHQLNLNSGNGACLTNLNSFHQTVVLFLRFTLVRWQAAGNAHARRRGVEAYWFTDKRPLRTYSPVLYIKI